MANCILVARVPRSLGFPPLEKLTPFVDEGPHAGNHWFWTGKSNKYSLPIFTYPECGSSAPFYVAHVLYFYHVGPLPKRGHFINVCNVARCIRPSHWSAVAPKNSVQPEPKVLRMKRLTQLPEPRLTYYPVHMRDVQCPDFTLCKREWQLPYGQPLTESRATYYKRTKSTWDSKQVTCRRCLRFV